MKPFYRDFTLGVIGGGQLGKMLIQSCANFHIATAVLDPDPHAPCRSLAGKFTQGSPEDFDTVVAFGKKADLVTIEIENVNVQALYRLEREGIPVRPEPRVIEIIQDKRVQKRFYRDHGIPTADFVLIESGREIPAHVDFFPAFYKRAKGGYDGGGVRRLDTAADAGADLEGPGLLEKRVDVAREIAVIAARGSGGEIAVYPPVECVFHPGRHLVDYLLAPSSADPGIQRETVRIARRVAETLEITGLLAVEMFVTAEGEVLVNEAAPRPHNSGHQTIDANATSQYEQQLRAILDLPLGSTAINKPSAMVNVLGEEGYTGEAVYRGLEDLLRIDGVKLFLYGKKLTRPYRKMGHVTILDDNMDLLKAKIEQVKGAIKVVA